MLGPASTWGISTVTGGVARSLVEDGRDGVGVAEGVETVE